VEVIRKTTCPRSFRENSYLKSVLFYPLIELRRRKGNSRRAPWNCSKLLKLNKVYPLFSFFLKLYRNKQFLKWV
jgi:hypothetical protein